MWYNIHDMGTLHHAAALEAFAIRSCKGFSLCYCKTTASSSAIALSSFSSRTFFVSSFILIMFTFLVFGIFLSLSVIILYHYLRK